MIFGNLKANEFHDSMKIGSCNKRDNFRKEIRRNGLKEKFSQMRNKLIEELQSQTLNKLLSKLNQQFEYQELTEMISIITNYHDNLDFNLKIASERIEDSLVSIILKNNQAITMIEKIKIIRILNYLTYYARESNDRLSEKEEFLDYLRRQIQKLNLTVLEHIVYLHEIICLLMNLSSLLKKDVNSYLAESDICHLINIKLGSTINFSKEANQIYKNAVFHVREALLRLYKNIVINLKEGTLISVNLIGQIVADQTYFIDHREKIFLLLAEAMKSSESFWASFTNNKEINQTFQPQIHYTIDAIQKRMLTEDFLQDKDNTLTEKEFKEFHSFIEYLNAMDKQVENNCIDFVETVEQFLNGYMLAQFLVMAWREKDRNALISALRLYRNISQIYDVTAEQLLIIKPVSSKDDLISIFTEEQLIKGPATSKYCLEILNNLTKKDYRYISTLMEFRIHEILAEILQKKENPVDMLVGAIHLASKLVINQVQGEQRVQNRKVLKIFQNKGIVNNIQNLVSHNNREVYTAAELFTEVIAKERQKQRQ